MKLPEIIAFATNKANFATLQGYYSFCDMYLDYVAENLQAVIVAKNEHRYRFYQYKAEANYQVTRPINSELMYHADDFGKNLEVFVEILNRIKSKQPVSTSEASKINNVVYTLQQSIGATLDALPAGRSNAARKLNGDLFENLIRLLLNEIGISCKTGEVKVPVIEQGKTLFTMRYQHDLIVEKGDVVRAIGSVKTSSKDRLDKIFVDKFLYNSLTETATPHFAIFLNDVQRKCTRRQNEFGTNSTFLPGHFKGYTVKLNPLDGVYYCDICPVMQTDSLLKEHIKTFDKLLLVDIWRLIN